VGIATARARLARFGAAVSVERCPGAGVTSSDAGEPSVAIERIDGERVRVRLLAPTEPLAWAIDPAPSAGQPFHARWHSERVPGVRPRPASTEAVVDAGPRATLGVRVFTDDGGVATAELRAETRG
jgi:hypothetical protein